MVLPQICRIPETAPSPCPAPESGLPLQPSQRGRASSTQMQKAESMLAARPQTTSGARRGCTFDSMSTPGWAFAVFDWGGKLLFERWGHVVTDPKDPLSLGASTSSNNTGELPAFAEAMICLICEAPPHWRDRGVVFAFDSTYAIGAGTGEWKTHDNQPLIKTVN